MTTTQHGASAVRMHKFKVQAWRKATSLDDVHSISKGRVRMGDEVTVSAPTSFGAATLRAAEMGLFEHEWLGEDSPVVVMRVEALS